MLQEIKSAKTPYASHEMKTQTSFLLRTQDKNLRDLFAQKIGQKSKRSWKQEEIY